MTRLIGSCGLVLAMLFASHWPQAQITAEKIRARVKPGQKMSIADNQGVEVRGRIGEMTADCAHRARRGESAEVRVQPDRHDRSSERQPGQRGANRARRWRGLGLVAVSAEDDGECPPEGFICSRTGLAVRRPAWLLFSGLGTAVGVGVDASSTVSARSTARQQRGAHRPRPCWGTAAAAW